MSGGGVRGEDGDRVDVVATFTAPLILPFSAWGAVSLGFLIAGTILGSQGPPHAPECARTWKWLVASSGWAVLTLYIMPLVGNVLASWDGVRLKLVDAAWMRARTNDTCLRVFGKVLLPIAIAVLIAINAGLTNAVAESGNKTAVVCARGLWGTGVAFAVFINLMAVGILIMGVVFCPSPCRARGRGWGREGFWCLSDDEREDSNEREAPTDDHVVGQPLRAEGRHECMDAGTGDPFGITCGVIGLLNLAISAGELVDESKVLAAKQQIEIMQGLLKLQVKVRS